MGNDTSARGRSRTLSIVAALLGGLGLILVILGLVGMLGTATPNMRGFNQGQSVSVGESGMSVWARSDDVREAAVCTASGDRDVVLERPVEGYSVEVAGSDFFEVARTPEDFAPGTYAISCEGTEESLYAGPRATRTVANGIMGQTGLLIGGILLAAAAVLGIGALLSRGGQRRADGPYAHDDGPAPYWQPAPGGYQPPGYAPYPQQAPQGYGQQGYGQGYPQAGYGQEHPQGGYGQPPYERPAEQGYDQGAYGPPPSEQQPFSQQGYPPAGATPPQGTPYPGFPPPPPGYGAGAGERPDPEHTQAIYGTGEHTQSFPRYGGHQDPYARPQPAPPTWGPPPEDRWQAPGGWQQQPSTGGWQPQAPADERPAESAPPLRPAPEPASHPEPHERPDAGEQADPDELPGPDERPGTEEPVEPTGQTPWLRPGAGRDGEADQEHEHRGDEDTHR